jgi:SSS family solute:Na+ symporter
MCIRDRPTGSVQRKLVNTSYLLFAIGVITLILGVFLSAPLAKYGFEAIFVISTLFLMLGMVIYTNAKMDVQDVHAISVRPTLFKTDVVFNVGAIGIIGIVVILYTLFWI